MYRINLYFDYNTGNEIENNDGLTNEHAGKLMIETIILTEDADKN